MNRRLVLTAGALAALAAWLRRTPRSHSEAPLSVAQLLGNTDAAQPFARAVAPRRFEFPVDHASHPEFRHEWWYFTGNLHDERARAYGFQLTFFRFALTPHAEPSDSAWRTREVYLAHYAVTDIAGGRCHRAEIMQRAALGLSGVSSTPIAIWCRQWRAALAASGPQDWELAADTEHATLHLTLTARKPVVPQGDRGLSRKGAAPGNASYYYSVPRLAARGALEIGGETRHVTGSAWLDREWGSGVLESGQLGWDWVGLQLDDGSELMFYRLRRTDGRDDPHSGGVWVAPDGTVTHLGATEVTIEITRHWRSTETGNTYPADCRLTIPRLRMTLQVRPALADQEWRGRIHYWEGAVIVRGTRDARALSGAGYSEYVGYGARG